MKKIVLLIMLLSAGLMISCSSGNCASSCCKSKKISACAADCTKSCCKTDQTKTCDANCTKSCCKK